MEDKKAPIPWDYFLTKYERDLLQLPLDEAMRKYPNISRERMTADLQELMQNQEQLTLNGGQN